MPELYLPLADCWKIYSNESETTLIAQGEAEEYDIRIPSLWEKVRG